MLTKMRNILPTIWKYISVPEIPWAPTLTAGQITMSTWAKIIGSYADVPKTYKEFFAPFKDGRAFPYTVFTPSRDGIFQKSTEKLVCIVGDDIYVLERGESQIEIQCYPIEGISYVEIKAILLDSHLKISGVTKQGIPAASTIRFNSVGEYLFKPILKRIRLAGINHGDAERNLELQKFDHLVKLNYKFMNYARHSLQNGEKVVHFVLQPEIRVPVVKILGKTYYKTIFPTHMSILTDRELITIREDDPKNRAAGKYGGIWNYIQLNKITAFNLNEKDNNLLALSIELAGKVRLEYLFQASARQELNQLLDRFKELNARGQLPSR